MLLGYLLWQDYDNLITQQINRTRIEHMLRSFDETMPSIFQIKINEDKISTAFKSLSIKIAALEAALKKMQAEREERGVFYCTEAETRAIINQIVFSNVQPLLEKDIQRERMLNTIKYNHDNLSSNMGDQLKKLTKMIEQFKSEQRKMMNEQEMRIKKDFEQSQMKIKENEELFWKFKEEYEEKENQYQQDIKKLQQTLKKMKRNNDTMSTEHKPLPKTVAFRHSEIRAIQPDFPALTASKTRNSIRRSIPREESPIDFNLNIKQKSVEYGSLISKIQKLQSKINDISTPRAQQKALISKERIETEPYEKRNTLTIPLQSNGTIIQKRKSKLPQPSRFRNSLKTSEDGQQSGHQAHGEKEKTNLSQEIRKLNNKFNDIRYKYTLVQQNYDIILNKISKINGMEATLQLKLDEVEKNRIDQITINEINMRFRKIQTAYQEHENKYVPNAIYESEIKKVNDSIRQIQTFSSCLAKNDEIKKAFEFIEAKIKEIIIVLTDKFQADRQGAINKVQQIRCLTCDKQVQLTGGNARMSLTTPSFCRSAKLKNPRSTYKKMKTQQCQK